MIAVTLRLLPQELQVTKYRRFSPLLSSVSGDRHVLQVTYSTRNDFSTPNHPPQYLRTEELTNISSQDVLNLLLLEATLDDQPSRTIHAARRTQLGEQELRNMFVGPLHAPADLRDVGEYGLLVAFPETLRRWDLIAPRATRQHIRVMAM